MDTAQLISAQAELKGLDQPMLEAEMWALIKEVGVLPPFMMSQFASARARYMVYLYLQHNGYCCEAHYLDSYKALVGRAGMALLTKEQLMELLIEGRKSWKKSKLIRLVWALPLERRLDKLVELGYDRGGINGL